MNNNLFKDNIAVIISQDGKEIIVLEKKEEKFHYETFDRINKETIPGIIDDLMIDIRAFSGYNLSLITAAKDYAIFMKINNQINTNELYLAVPYKVTKQQYETINKILKELKDNILYVFVCEKNEKIDYVFTNSIASYLMNKEEKTLDEIKEVSIVDLESNYHK